MKPFKRPLPLVVQQKPAHIWQAIVELPPVSVPPYRLKGEHGKKGELIKDALFRVFVEGATQAALLKFMQRLETGRVRVGITVQRVSGRQKLRQPVEPAEITVSGGAISKHIGAGKIRMGISRMAIFPYPHVIQYTITDPPAADDTPFFITFDKQYSAHVNCDVDRGEVQLTLSNLTTAHVDHFFAFAGRPVDYKTEEHQSPCNWLLAATVTQYPCHFTLGYSKYDVETEPKAAGHHGPGPK